MDRQTKILNNLKTSISEGEYYEAHQRARTLVNRYVTKQQFASSFKLLIEIAGELFKLNQKDSASDLCLMYLEVLKKKEKFEKSTFFDVDKYIDDILLVFECFDLDSLELTKFINSLLEMSKRDDAIYGDQQLQWHIGNFFYEKKSYEKAKTHFLHSDSGKEIGEICAIHANEEFNIKGEDTTKSILADYDQKFGASIFELLSQMSIPQASQALKVYNKKFSHSQGSLISNFVKFTIESIKTKNWQNWHVVLDKYRNVWEAVPKSWEYLNKISAVIFDGQKLRPSFFDPSWTPEIGREERRKEEEAKKNKKNEFDLNDMLKNVGGMMGNSGGAGGMDLGSMLGNLGNNPMFTDMMNSALSGDNPMINNMMNSAMSGNLDFGNLLGQMGMPKTNEPDNTTKNETKPQVEKKAEPKFKLTKTIPKDAKPQNHTIVADDDLD